MLLNGGSYVSGSASSSSWFGSAPSTHTLRSSSGGGSGGTARAISRAPKSSEAIQRRQTAQLNRAAQQFEAQKAAQGESIASAANRQNQVKDLGKGTDPNALRDPEEAARLAKATAQKVQEKPEEGWLSQAAGAVGDGLQALWDGTCWVGQKIWDGIAAVGAGIWWTVSSIGQGAWWLTSNVGQGLWWGATNLYTAGSVFFGSTAGMATLGVGAVAVANDTTMSGAVGIIADTSSSAASNVMDTGRALNDGIAKLNNLPQATTTTPA